MAGCGASIYCLCGLQHGIPISVDKVWIVILYHAARFREFFDPVPVCATPDEISLNLLEIDHPNESFIWCSQPRSRLPLRPTILIYRHGNCIRLQNPLMPNHPTPSITLLFIPQQSPRIIQYAPLTSTIPFLINRRPAPLFPQPRRVATAIEVRQRHGLRSRATM